MNHVRHLSVSIDRSADEAYDFLSDPANFPKWARAQQERSWTFSANRRHV